MERVEYMMEEIMFIKNKSVADRNINGPTRTCSIEQPHLTLPTYGIYPRKKRRRGKSPKLATNSKQLYIKAVPLQMLRVHQPPCKHKRA